MASTDEMRAWLRDNGHEVTARGRLSGEMRAVYDAAHPEDAGPAAAPDGDPDWDLDSGDGDVADADETEPSVPLQPERAPRTARAGRRERRARPAAERLFGRRDKPAAKPKVRHKRVPVDHLIGRAWEALARLAAPVSLPVSRCLQVQSPVAGMILEDIIAGTAADRILQPVARAEEKTEKVIALVAPPVLVLALEQTQFLEPQQAAMRQAMIVPMLRESLRIWLQVAGPKVEQAARREAEYQEKFGSTIDEMIALFMGVGAAEDSGAAGSAEAREPVMAGA